MLISEEKFNELSEEEKNKVITQEYFENGKKKVKLFYEPEYFDTQPLSEIENRKGMETGDFLLIEKDGSKDKLKVEIHIEEKGIHKITLYKSGQGFIDVAGASSNNFEQNYRRETKGCDFGYYKQSFTKLCKQFNQEYWGKFGDKIEKIVIIGNKRKRSIFKKHGLNENF